MTGFVGRRLLRSFLLLIGVSAFSFGLLQLAPGDYFDELRLDPAISETTIAGLRAQHGLRDALPVRYARWLGSLLEGDWGFSIAYRVPVAPLVWERAGNTLVLTLSANLVAWAIAIPLAIWAAAGRNWRGMLLGGIISSLLATPDLLMVLALLFIAAWSGFLFIGGMTSHNFEQMSHWGRVEDVALHLLIPGTALVLSALPVLLSHARASLAEVLESSYIVAARANGIPRLRLLVRHALPAAVNPLVTLFGLSIGTLLSSSLIVEAVVGWPGLGNLLLQAILQRDLYVVVGAVTLSAGLLVAGNLAADILLYAADPRIREEP